MIKILSEEQSFAMMENKFAKLRPYDVLDLCYEGDRYPAIVVSVDHLKREFSVIKIDTEAARLCCWMLVHPGSYDAGLEPITVSLPSKPSEEHAMWNSVGK